MMFDVMNCHASLNIIQFHNMTQADFTALGRIVLQVWFNLYSNKAANRLAFGRFMKELASDLQTRSDQHLLVYSGMT